MTTTTVETMTAEVHVLTIGTSRLTASTYKQLDVCAIRDMEVFGRVRSGLKIEDGWGYKDEPDLELVGRDADGRLVRSFVRQGHLPPRRLADIADRAERVAEFEKWRTAKDQAMAELRSLPLIVLGR